MSSRSRCWRCPNRSRLPGSVCCRSIEEEPEEQLIHIRISGVGSPGYGLPGFWGLAISGVREFRIGSGSPQQVPRVPRVSSHFAVAGAVSFLGTIGVVMFSAQAELPSRGDYHRRGLVLCRSGTICCGCRFNRLCFRNRCIYGELGAPVAFAPSGPSCWLSFACTVIWLVPGFVAVQQIDHWLASPSLVYR